MYYHSLYLSGFGPYSGEQKHEFDDGTIIITGPNGSGKTTIMDAISWALYGPRAALRSVKDRTSVINSSSQTAKVTLVVYTDEEELTITRTLTRSGGHNLKVYDGSEEYSGITICQKIINEFTGVEADVFTAVSTYSSAPSMVVNPFISSNDRNRRDFLADLVDPEGLYESTNKIVRKRITEHKRELQHLVGRLEGIQESSPEEPDLDRLTEVEKEIKEYTVERRRLEQRMSAARSRDDQQIAGLIDTHRSEMESLSTRVTELILRRDKTTEAMDNNDDILDTLEKEMSKINKHLHRADKIISSLEYEEEACDTRVHFLRKERRVLESRYSDLKARHYSVNDLLSLSEDMGDNCALCGAPVTDISHHHLDGLDNTLESLEDEMKKLSKRMDDILMTVDSVEAYKKSLLDKMDRNNPDKIKNDLDKVIDKFNRINDENESMINDVNQYEKDISELNRRIEHHKSMVDDLTRDVDPDVLDRQDTMNSTWDFLSDQIAESIAEQSRIEDQQIAWDKYQKKVSTINESITKMTKILAQLDNLKHQTSPIGDISDRISSLADSISVTATEYASEVFDREETIQVMTVTEDDEAVCSIQVDERDLSTWSHGEQVRFIIALLTSLAEVNAEVSGRWLPLLWDEPTMATDVGVTSRMLDSISDEGNRQVMVLTRDEFPDNSVDLIVEPE